MKGFSLIEIILVVFIVGFMVLFIADIPSALKIVGVSSRESIAKEIALKVIEDTRAQSYDNLANTSDPPPSISDSRLGSLPSGSAIYTIIDCPVSICTNGELVKQATVKIAWVEGGSSRSLELVTLIAKGGLR